MAVAECALEKKVYCFGIKYEHVIKMRKYLGVGDDVSVGAMFEKICEDLFSDVKLTANERRWIDAEIESNRKRREEMRNRWPQMERRRKDQEWRKARYKAKMAARASGENETETSKKGGAK